MSARAKQKKSDPLEPMTCLFCLEPVENDDEIWQLTGTRRTSLAKSCFLDNSQYIHDLLLSSMDCASYCDSCNLKITEIRLVQKNIKKLRLQMKDLANDLEAFVIRKHSIFENSAEGNAGSNKNSAEIETCFSDNDGTFGADIEYDADDNASTSETSPTKTENTADSNPIRTTSSGKHTSSSKSNNLRCTVSGCDKTFNRATALSAHILAHQGQERYERTLARRRERRRARKANMKVTVPVPDSKKTTVKIENCLSNDEGAPKDIEYDADDNAEISETLPTKTENTADSEPTPTSSLKHTRSSKSNELRCTVSGCDKTFNRESAQHAHILAHQGQQRHERILARRRERQRARTRANIKGFACTFPGCERIFSQQAMQYCHIKKVHEGVTSFKCSQCDKEYAMPCLLKFHERVKHSGESPYQCTTCGKRFTTNRSLKNHMNLHEDVHVCEVCGKRCGTPAELKLHSNTHSSVKPYFCELCGYSCSTKRYLETHQANHHEGETEFQPIKCSVCSRNLANKRSLEKHLVTKHGIGEAAFRCTECDNEKAFHTQRELDRHRDTVHLKVKNYECPLCHMKFSSRSHLRPHTERHHVAKDQRERPFECSVCARRFYLKKTLENHEKIHSNERPFGCQQCKARFPSKNYLALHVYTVHNNRQRKRKRDEEPIQIEQEVELADSNYETNYEDVIIEVKTSI